MLLRTVIFAAIAALLATQIPSMIQLADQPPATTAAAEPAQPQSVAAAAGSAVLEADGRGHFNGTFRINGKSVDGLVDTGASLVAINESTARKLGFGANSLDFRYTVNTANGGTDAARVVLGRIEIGGVRVKDVDAFVLHDKALSGTLVGMSFLKKLKSFQVQGRNLKLTQ
ncbi:aspartyl protease family protein [Neorhizobium sp. R1-B]|uniref:TIGR02281 family clan AA aspartic protease n=1 Tax=Neorhizobium sp. R1-B TaxID=2485162 RepID=UPI001065C03B|nr:TIGR02281 family clan AA aspartic protease [Neorhizobium sp. R1-B]TDX77758.1 aspartyl protease family protein [Neorhizobium sp. R1-B]